MIEVSPTPARRRGALLFTAFEPSGDDHASAVIAELKRRDPDLPIFAWGGPKMQRAGAEIIERTGDDAVMGVPGLAKIVEHWRINRRIDEFLEDNTGGDTPVVLHVPVDSPAANMPICAIAKKRGLKVVHLVAPQIWAWGRWRVHKLRRLTDRVLCVLAFEEEFFLKRGVPAKFIGHFLFDHELDTQALDARAHSFGAGSPRIAMMPGSRPNELDRHLPILLDAFRALKTSFPDAVGVVAATTAAVAERLRRSGTDLAGGWPEGLSIIVGETDAVIRWCDIALVKSGTVTLQVARQGRPMVVFYKKSNPFLFLVARTILSTKYFSLPNVIAHKRIVPELVPHFGGAEPIVEIAERLLREPGEAKAQTDAVADVLAKYRGLDAAKNAADEILNMLATTNLRPAGPAAR